MPAASRSPPIFQFRDSPMSLRLVIPRFRSLGMANLFPGSPAAKQGGAYVASVLRSRLRGRKPPPPFRYRHQGSLATIGRRSAVADFGRVRVTGATAWWLWGAVHVFFLVGVRNRLSVMLGWVWSYFTFDVGARLITERGADQPTPIYQGQARLGK